MPERPSPPPATTRRRRPAPDWGGDELFTRVRSRGPAPWDEIAPLGGGDARDEVDRELAALIDGRRGDAPGGVEGRPGRAATPSRDAEAPAVRHDAGAASGRRTIRITGRPGETAAPRPRRRPPRRAHERLGPRPDRVAAWAVALGLLLALIAIATADAATTALTRLP